MRDQLTTIQEQALASLEKVASAKSLEEWRVAYLGRKGPLT
ncbi:MAG: phenylalanine--tRNA ligase subunit alpha, partial [Chloroflexi bacterium]|nr:phenylalanine--tRNA ligase subunit alpha [Chloroflexota bacterium]